MLRLTHRPPAYSDCVSSKSRDPDAGGSWKYLSEANKDQSNPAGLPGGHGGDSPLLGGSESLLKLYHHRLLIARVIGEAETPCF